MFHADKSQDIERITQELKFSPFPQDLEEYKLPLEKPFAALKELKGSNLILDNMIVPF